MEWNFDENINDNLYSRNQEYIKSKEIIEKLFNTLKEKLEQLDTKWYEQGTIIGLNKCDIQIQKEQVRAEYDKIGSISNSMLNVQKSIIKQNSMFFKKIDVDLLTEYQVDEKRKLISDLDESDSESFISKKRNDINKYKQELEDLDKREWNNLKDQLYVKTQKVWNDHDSYITNLLKKKQDDFLCLLAYLEQKDKMIQQAISALLESLLNIEGEIASLTDINQIEQFTNKRNVIYSIIDDHRSQRRSLISSVTEEAEKLENIYSVEISHSIKLTKNHSGNLLEAISKIPENPTPKSRIYLLILFLGFLFAATAEIAIMNKFTGEVMKIGTIYDKLEEISDNSSLNLTEFETPIENEVDNNNWSFVGNLVELLFLFTFSTIPFLLSFVTKLWFDLRNSLDDSKKYFFYAAASVLVIYIVFLSISTVKQKEETWEFGVLLASISMSLVLVSGYLLHIFIKGYENFKQATKQNIFSLKTSYSSTLEKRISKLSDTIETKNNDLNNINKEISNTKANIHLNSEKFASLESGIPDFDIGSLKESAIKSLEAGHEFGLKTRGKGLVDEKFLENKTIEDLMELRQKLQFFYDVFGNGAANA